MREISIPWVRNMMSVSSSNAPVVFVYQRMLPYHRDRFQAVFNEFSRLGRKCIAVEVTDHDRSYGRIASHGSYHEEKFPFILTLFPGIDYLDLQPYMVAKAVNVALNTISPDTIFTPAPAFAEGAGALHYKANNACRLILMDDSWEETDRRGWLTRTVKRLLYSLFDGAFIPSSMHTGYFSNLNIPIKRQRFPVDVVAHFSPASSTDDTIFIAKKPYLLFVGRLVKVKRLEVVIQALATPELMAIKLVVIGDGPEANHLQQLSNSLGLSDRVHWLGRLPNEHAREWIINAEALVLPSQTETWGLVANESWSVGVPVIGSNSVGALRATYSSKEFGWMMLKVGDIHGWRMAIKHLISMKYGQRTELSNRMILLAQQYTLSAHACAALCLADLPLRKRPFVLVNYLALTWSGRVAVY